ncbi:MAG: potassium channel family protein [Acidobacteriota bacterium]
MSLLLKPRRSQRRFGTRPFLFLARSMSRMNAVLLTRLLMFFLVIVAAYSALFHVLMHEEGKSYHWFVGVYWTIATMTTVGYGDVVFQSLAGMVFSVIVIVTGIFFILVTIPFVLIRLFQSGARVPREVPEGMSGHVILTHDDPVTSVLIRRLGYYESPYILLTPEVTQAADERDRGINAVLGETDDPSTYAQVGIGRAALLATTADDVTNTVIIHAARECSDSVNILTTSTEPESLEILRAAGADDILSLDEMMGQSLARRTIAGDAIAHVIGHLGTLTIAEAAARATPLAGRTLSQAQLRAVTGLECIGILEGPEFFLADPERIITKHSILILAGSMEDVARYNELFCIYNASDDPVIVIGAGNVGRWVARSFDEHGLEYRIIEKNPDKRENAPNVSITDAAKVENLKSMGFFRAPAVVIATHRDDTNIYLATLFRSLRKDIQIVSRATLERSVALLHKAGCDIVLSSASFGATFILNHLKRGTYLMLSEGVDVFRIRTPRQLSEKTAAEIAARLPSGCRLIAVTHGEAPACLISSDGSELIREDSEMILIADADSEAAFLHAYGRGL